MGERILLEEEFEKIQHCFIASLLNESFDKQEGSNSSQL